MKVFTAHNFYQQQGGEDVVFASETRLLRRYGNEVIEYSRHNKEIADYGIHQYTALPARVFWNWDSYFQIRRILRIHRPDVAHFHNIFPLISPAAYAACWACNVPVVQTLHNSRLFCPSGGLFYKGRYCQKCLGQALPWTGVGRACYRNSHLQTGLVGLMAATHRTLGTWTTKVDRYIAFNSFFRNKFIEAGLPARKIAIKPHFLEDPGLGATGGGYALYVGRLSESKGVHTLLNAWDRLQGIPLKICGTGDMECVLQRRTSAQPEGLLQWVPSATREKVLELMKGASFLVWPSEAVESFGLVALEAFACGKPVISSGLGSMPELVEEHRMGLRFRAGDAGDLAEKILWAWTHKDEMTSMGQAARRKYEFSFSEESNYKDLMRIYGEAIEEHRSADGLAFSHAR